MATIASLEADTNTTVTEAATAVDVTEIRKDRLLGGEALFPGQELISENKKFSLTLRKRDGNLLLYQLPDDVIWSTDVEGYGVNRAAFEASGCLKLYSPLRRREIWRSIKEEGDDVPDAACILKNDGNLVTTIGNKQNWQSGSARVPPPMPLTRPDRIEVGQGLLIGQSLKSPNAKYQLLFQNDGNLVLYEEKWVLWADKLNIHKPKGIAQLTMQADGNLAAYDKSEFKWSTKTDGKGNASSTLILRDDGNLVIISSNQEIWSTKTSRSMIKPQRRPDLLEVGQVLRTGEQLTSPNGKYKLVVQDDCKVVLYSTSRGVIWAQPGNGSRSNFQSQQLVIQEDGNLVLSRRHDGMVDWASGSNGRGNVTSTFALLDTGNAILYSDGKEIWSTGTHQRAAEDRLFAGEVLYHGDKVTGPNKNSRFTMQADGNLVLYDGDKVRWASNTTIGVRPGSATLRHTDSLTVGDWSSNTTRRQHGGKAVLSLNAAGDVLIESDGIVLWSNNGSLVQPWEPVDLQPVKTDSDKIGFGQYLPVGQSLLSQNKLYRATLQSDGNFVLRRVDNNDIVWETKTASNSVTKLAMGWDGEAAIYDANRSKIWTFDVEREEREFHLIVENDGNITIQQPGVRYKLLWSSDTKFPVSIGKVDRLLPGENLALDQDLVNGDSKLRFQSNGRIIIYQRASGYYTEYLTNPNITTAKFLVFRQDRNTYQYRLELQDQQRKVLWASTARERSRLSENGLRLQLDDEGKAWICTDEGECWSTDDMDRDIIRGNRVLQNGASLISPNGAYRLVMQRDGNFVLYNRNKVPVWASNTSMHKNYLKLEPNGQAVVYDAYRRVWYSSPGKDDVQDTRMYVRDDGDIRVWADETLMWASNTAGK